MTCLSLNSNDSVARVLQVHFLPKIFFRCCQRWYWQGTAESSLAALWVDHRAKSLLKQTLKVLRLGIQNHLGMNAIIEPNIYWFKTGAGFSAVIVELLFSLEQQTHARKIVSVATRCTENTVSQNFEGLKMFAFIENAETSKCDSVVQTLSWMGKTPDNPPESGSWRLNEASYYHHGWLASGNARGIVGVTFTSCQPLVADHPARTNFYLRGHRSEVSWAF